MVFSLEALFLSVFGLELDGMAGSSSGAGIARARDFAFAFALLLADLVGFALLDFAFALAFALAFATPRVEFRRFFAGVFPLGLDLASLVFLRPLVFPAASPWVANSGGAIKETSFSISPM